VPEAMQPETVQQDAGAPAKPGGPLDALRGPFGGYALLVLAGAVLYWPTLESLWRRWAPDPSYSHGWLIFAIAGWLVWREAQAGRLDGGRPHWLGVAALPVLGTAWLVAMAGSIGLAQWLLLPAFLFALAFALYGWTALTRLWFPIGFTLFAIPMWDWLAPVLQAITVEVVGMALMALRIPALLDGNRVELPAGSFEIVKDCSGMHYFVVSGTLAVLYGWLWYRRFGLTLGLLAVALGVAVVANWLRVFLVIYAGYLTDMQHYLVTVDHYYFGWVMYMLLMAPVFLLARRFEPEEAPAGATQPAGSTTPPARWRPHFIGALAALAVAPLAWAVLTSTPTRPAPEALPPGQAGWELHGVARPDWTLRYLGPHALLSGVYWRDGRGVDAWIAWYGRPAQASEVASSSNRLAQRADGDLHRSGREAVLTTPGGRRVIRHVHIIGQRESTGLKRAKLDQIIGTLSGQPEAAVLAFSAPCADDCDAARALLDDFERDMGGSLRAAIAGSGPGAGQE
jgi:exosortase A